MLPDRMIPFWDSESNPSPVEQAFPKSVRPTHWIDPVCGHKWVQRIGILTTIFEKMDKGLRSSVCPACEGNVLITGINDLGTTHPELRLLWCKSNTIIITEVSKGSAKVAAWKCDRGHVWKGKIKDQAVKGAWCRQCNHKSSANIPKGKTLLKDSHPDLYEQVVSVIEAKKAPELLATGSSLMVEWECLKGHIYKAKVANRTSLGRDCPYCSGRYAIAGENDIATTNPEIMKFWDYKVNTLRPEEVKKTYSKSLHWICERDHRWESVPESLTLRAQYCPFCSGKKVIPGETDFASVYPEKLSLWNYAKNDIAPQNISAGNRKKVHWQCSVEHEWEAPIYTVAAYEKTTGCPVCAGHAILRGFNDLSSNYPELLKEWNYAKNIKEPHEYTKASGQSVWWICAKNHEWKTSIGHRAQGGNGCPECACGINASKAERIISEWVTELLPDEIVMTNTRKIIKGYELDIYVPARRIAIEYNGIYWHSEEAGKDKNYHHDKWAACKEAGIQLIQVWEDEWNRNPAQIKRMLAHKLGISNEKKVFARKTVVSELDKLSTELFLNENHVQGYASGSHYLGLKDKVTDELIAVLVLKKEAGTGGKILNIIRYATSANVVGGFTKLLKHAEKTYHPERFITFSDHCVSDGGLYENNGFIADKELPPDYSYVSGTYRKHKFGYRLKRFQNDPDLLWEEGLTERELAKLNKLLRIWDAGKTRWVLTLP